MAPIDVPFEGVEAIPNLINMTDANGETIFMSVQGDCPIVIVAPHAGIPSTTPEGARAFGERTKDPSTGRTPTILDDSGTQATAFAIVRTLAGMGFVPHVVINRVSRHYMDLNRRWEHQAMWVDQAGNYRPGDESKTNGDFPRVDEFRIFKEAYYDRFHGTVRSLTTMLHPNGWLFDIHGENVQGSDLVTFIGYGHYARRDYVYDNGDVTLHAHLLRQGFALDPAVAAPGDEVGARSAPISNLISGDRYGASSFNSATDPIPRPDNIIPSQPHRVHGVQLEFARSLRGGPPEKAESVGARVAYAIVGFLCANGVISRPDRHFSGEGAIDWFTQMV